MPPEAATETKILLELDLQDVKDAKDCLIYAEFKKYCAKFEVPVPIDAFDVPTRDRSGLLGALHVWYTEERTAEHWASRVMSMPYKEQVKTFYRMVYNMVPRDLTFEQWFSYNGLPLG